MTSEGHLGASEFAATLNGDNPQEILKVLKQFVRTIRRDRRLALSLEDQDSDQEDEESSDEEDVEQPPAKKLKKSEDWKEDTASYHVPFVGTSVAKSDAAEVVKGEWPTGLLKAYLMKSPLAIELTSDDLIAPEGQIHRSLVKRKKGKMSRDISKAYLLALAELVTAAIPARKLKDEEASASDTGVVDPDPAQFKFLPALLKKHLGSIFKLINDETDRGRGKQGVFGGCGSIAPPSLKLLQNISMISTTNARLIARYLDEELSDNVLKVLLRPPPPPKQPSENDAKERKVLSKHARVETINLATRLVQAEDSAVATYICTAGSRERKVKPGILYISFREGLASHSHSNVGTEADDNYLDAVADMLSGVRSILLNNSRVISHKQVVELLSRDPMNHLCQLVTHGPPLKPGNTFYDASIEGGESDQDLDVLENVGLEARRLLFPLLSNTSTSPFLHYVERDANWSKNYGQHLVRSLIHLLHVPNGGIQMRRFLAHCLKETPILLPGLFRTLTFPEPKKTFDFISSLNFVTTLLRCGPSPLTCLPLIGTQGNESDTSESLLTILPVKLKKHPLAKGLQSENPLIVLECLKLVLSALERFDALKSEGKLKRKWSDEYMENLSETFKHWLPDLQILLTVRTRHDAFLNRSKANVLISDCLYRVLEAFASVLPSSVRASKFDWMKMLPSSNTFSKAVPFVQRRVLKSLIKIIEACDSLSNNFMNSCKTVLEIMLTTRCQIVHTESRSLALSLLVPIMVSESSDPENSRSIEFESSCWIDGLTIECLPTFCKVLHDVSNNALNIIASVGRAWTKFKMSEAPDFSPLLMASLLVVDGSAEFSSFVAQVTARCLLFLRNPMPLAALIQYVSTKGDRINTTKTKAGIPLVDYSNVLLAFDGESGSKRFEQLGEMLRSCFAPGNQFLIAHSWLKKSKVKKTGKIGSWFEPPENFEKSLAFSKFLIHIVLVARGAEMVEDRGWALLRRAVPTMLLQLSSERTAYRSATVFKDIYAIQGNEPSNHSKVLNVLVTSCPFASRMDFVQDIVKECTVSLYDSAWKTGEGLLSSEQTRSSFLQLSLVGQILPANSIAKLMQSFLGGHKTRGRQLSDTTLRLLLCFIGCSYRSDDRNANYGSDVLKEMFQMWWSLSSNNKEAGSSFRRQTMAHVGFMLTQVLNKDDIESAMFVALMNEKPVGAFLDRCIGFRTKEAFEEDPILSFDQDSGFLKSILWCDFSRFAPSLLAKFRQKPQHVSTAWENGLLDPAALVLLRRSSELPGEAESYKELADMILSRIVFVFSNMTGENSLDEATGLLEITVETLKTKIRSDHLGDLLEEVPRLLFSVSANKQFQSDGSTKYLCQIGMLIVTKFAGVVPHDKIEILSSTLLSLFCEWIPNEFKNHDAHTGANCETILTWLITLLTDVEDYDSEVFRAAKPSLVQKVYRCCLKHGIAGSVGSTRVVQAKCLKLVRLLIGRLADPQSTLGKIQALVPTYSPFEVFTMLTSHSKFDVALSRTEEDGKVLIDDCDQLEMVRLMICCVTLSPGSINIEPAVWAAVFSVFNAGLGSIDTAIRRLLYTYCNSSSKDSYLPFLDEFRWKGSVDIVSKEGNRWDWFLNALENNRMRATVSHFPVFDTMDLDSKSSKNEIGAAENKRSLEKGKTIAAQSGEYEEAEDDGMEDAEGTTHKDESGSEICLETNSLCPGVEWNRQGPDMRYSPAFLLPLILGALESGLCTDNTETKEDAIDSLSTTRNGGIFSEFQYNSSFIHIAKRLCEKGALSLCLASLASRCEEVRGVAISCLGLLLRACTTGEARKLASWRERPQLAMLLNSVQRAFVLKQASNISSGYGSGLLTLSPIVSTFLARASFSVSKPDDALFEPLNRYFLKSDADHGAFQDMGRLPGFISLFCSSSEDSVQSRKERLWALQLLRDGFLDTTCYKLAASCHAPELILTSFENVRLSQCTDDMKGAECTLLLEVLKTLIDYGGSRAASHLVGRMGLLSWMRSLCIGTPLVESFPTIKSSINFCELLCSAVESASLNSRLRSDNLVHELCGLTEPVLILCLDRNDTKDRSPANCDMHGDSLLASAVCEALRSLRKALSRLKEEGLECSDVQSVGISLTEALRFLKLLPSDLFEQVTPLLSCLPLCLEHSSREEAAEFCSLLLQSCQNTQEDTAKTHSVLERVVLIIHHFGVGAADGDVLAMLLSLRSRFVLTTPGLLLWQKCLQQFLLASNNTLKGSPTDSIEVSVAKSFLLKNG